MIPKNDGLREAFNFILRTHWGITNIYYKCYSKVIFLQKYT